MLLTIALAMSTITNRSNGTTLSPPAKWTAEELMHGKEGVVDDLAASAAASLSLSSTSPSKKVSKFSMRKMGAGKKPPADPMDWGMPGHLTEEEVAIFVSCLPTFVVKGGDFEFWFVIGQDS
jgi:hypothetical protein